MPWDDILKKEEFYDKKLLVHANPQGEKGM